MIIRIRHWLAQKVAPRDRYVFHIKPLAEWSRRDLYEYQKAKAEIEELIGS